MAKTKAVLLFGAHQRHGTADMPDRDFFRRETRRFFKDWISEEGKKATVIHECVLMPKSCADSLRPENKVMPQSFFERFGPEAREQTMAEIIEAQESQMPEFERWLEHLNTGRCLESDVVKDGFGIIDIIAEINVGRPGTIWNYIEPQHAYAVFEHFYAERCRGELLRAIIDALIKDRETALEEDRMLLGMAVKVILWQTSSIVKRDSEVAKLAIGLRGVDPSRAIVIVRGADHRGLSSLFETRLFDVQAIHSELSVELLKTAAIHVAPAMCDGTSSFKGTVKAAIDFLRELKAMALGIMEKIRQKDPDMYAEAIEAMASMEKED